MRATVGEEGENDLYLDVKYRLLWFRLHHPNGKIDPELIQVDEKNAIVCCKVYADKADLANQFIGKAYVFNGDWKSASQLTKTEVLSGHVQEARIYHTEKWYERTGKLISRAAKRVA